MVKKSGWEDDNDGAGRFSGPDGSLGTRGLL